MTNDEDKGNTVVGGGDIGKGGSVTSSGGGGTSIAMSCDTSCFSHISNIAMTPSNVVVMLSKVTIMLASVATILSMLAINLAKGDSTAEAMVSGSDTRLL